MATHRLGGQSRVIKKILTLLIFCFSITSITAQTTGDSALSVDQDGNVKIEENLSIDGTLTVEGTSDFSHLNSDSVTVAGNVSAQSGTIEGTQTVGSLDANQVTADSISSDSISVQSLDVYRVGGFYMSQPIYVMRPEPYYILIDDVDWTTELAGMFEYHGGITNINVDYSAFSSYGSVYADMRLKLTPINGGNPVYLPDESGWRHHSNEETTHISRSLSFLLESLQKLGEYQVQFEVKIHSDNSALHFQIDYNDYFMVTILEFPQPVPVN